MNSTSSWAWPRSTRHPPSPRAPPPSTRRAPPGSPRPARRGRPRRGRPSAGGTGALTGWPRRRRGSAGASAALYDLTGEPALREAIAWQNRHALATGIDMLRRHGPEPARRKTKDRQHESLVASYLQRYCAKNDTIGFFGPVGWSQFDEGPG